MADLTKEELLARIVESRAHLEQLLAGLSPADYERQRADGWSFKQHLAHLSAWRRSLLALLNGESRDAALGLPENAHETLGTEGINERLATRAAATPLDEVLAEFRASHDDVLARLRELTDADLQRPYADFDPTPGPYSDHPIIGWIDGNTYEHDDEHLLWMQSALQSS